MYYGVMGTTLETFVLTHRTHGAHVESLDEETASAS